MRCYLLDQILQVSTDFCAFDGRRQPFGQAAQLIFLFHQKDIITLVGQPQSRVHPGHPSADDQSPLNYRDCLFFEGNQSIGPCDRHAHQILGFGGGLRLGPGMHPGILIADVGHFKQVFVQAAAFHGILENRFMGLGTAGRNNHSIQAVFFDDLFHPVL